MKAAKRQLFFLVLSSFSFSTTLALMTLFLPGGRRHSCLFSLESPSEEATGNNLTDDIDEHGANVPAPVRRDLLGILTATVGTIVTGIGTSKRTSSDYPLWGILPVGPYKRKKTILTTLVQDKIYTMEQKFGVLDVQVPIRAVVVALDSGGLLVYNPVSPTEEVITLVDTLIKKHGPVKTIVVGSVALEVSVVRSRAPNKHKVWQLCTRFGDYAIMRLCDYAIM